MNDQDEHRYQHRGRPDPPAAPKENPAPPAAPIMPDELEHPTASDRVKRVLVDWMFPLLVLGAIGAAIVYALLSSGVVSRGP